jgi:hypothetical protein
MVILENLLHFIVKRLYRHTNIMKLNLKTTTSKEKVQLPLDNLNLINLLHQPISLIQDNDDFLVLLNILIR